MIAKAAQRHDSGSATIRGRTVGAAVLSIAGTWWGWQPAARLPITPGLAHGLLIAAGLSLFVAAADAIRRYRGPAIAADRRLMTISIVVEVAAIFGCTNLVANLGRPDLILPTVGLIVGLHFLPLARAFRYPPYRVLGLAIVGFAVASMALPGPAGLTLLGAGVAACLMLASLDMTLRLRAKARTAVAGAA